MAVTTGTPPSPPVCGSSCAALVDLKASPVDCFHRFLNVAPLVEAAALRRREDDDRAIVDKVKYVHSSDST